MMPRRLKLTTDGQSNVFSFGNIERPQHVYMKAFIWALYLPDYPDLSVEIRVGDRYKPDVVSIDEARAVRDINAAFRFWGEAGRVGADKIESLARRFPHTHFAIAKWGRNLGPLTKQVRAAIDGHGRTAPFDLIRFEDGDESRFIDEKGNVRVTFDAVDWVRLMPEDG